MAKPFSQWDKESNLVKHIRAVLRILSIDSQRGKMRGPLVFWRNDGSPKITGKRGRLRFVPSDTKGQADFEIAILGMPRIHIEAKSTVGKQSSNQKAHQERVESVGEKYFIVRSPQEFANALIGCGLEHWLLTAAARVSPAQPQR